MRVLKFDKNYCSRFTPNPTEHRIKVIIIKVTLSMLTKLIVVDKTQYLFLFDPQTDAAAYSLF